MNARTLWKLVALLLTFVAPTALADWRGDGNIRRKKVKVNSDEYAQGQEEKAQGQAEEAQEQEEEAQEEDEDGPGGEGKGFSLGVRAGYGVPFGKASGGTGSDESLSDSIPGIIPFQLDAGYFFNSQLYLGGSFQYALGRLAEDCSGEVSCSASVMRFSVNAAYHLLPQEKLDPWVGLGVGYERFTLSSSISVEGLSATTDLSAGGFEFASLQGGADYRIGKNLYLGPYVTFTAAQYSSLSLEVEGSEPMSGDDEGEVSGDSSIEEKAFHFWLMGGVRLRFRF